MQKFFIDIANPDVIKTILEKIDLDNLSERLSGITTNPKALAKYFNRDFSLEDLKSHLTNLNICLQNLKAKNPIIYVQIPSDEKTTINLSEMCNFVQSLDFKVGIKIPHYYYFLNEIHKYKDISFNVTGVSDFLIASKCLSYPVDYVSIIPGRMEEKGIEYIDGLNLLSQNYNYKNRVIAGSMRTLSQLKTTLLYDCVPTIGETAFNNIFAELESPKQFINLFDNPLGEYCDFNSKNVPETHLSMAFFEEMNTANLLKL